MTGIFAPEESFPVPWDQARRDLARHLQGHGRGLDTQQLDDLVQEACVRLLRAARTGAVREPQALLATVAHRTWVDFVRRQRRARERFSPLGDQADHVADHDTANAELGGLLDRLELVVQEVFAGRGAGECETLARAFFAEHDWRQVAATTDVSYSAVRKRWSRCLALLREVLGADPDFEVFIVPGKGSPS